MLFLTCRAVLFAFGMLIGQMAGSIASSQALFIGRRICIRLRAILITEIITKALRRRDVGGRSSKGSNKTAYGSAVPSEAGESPEEVAKKRLSRVEEEASEGPLPVHAAETARTGNSEMALESDRDPKDQSAKEAEGEGEEEGDRATDGQVVNLISVDVFKVSEICAYL